MFVEFFSIFDLNTWWGLILQHRVLRILRQHPVTSHLAPLWVPLPLLGTHSHRPSSLASAKPDWLQLIFSGSTCVWLALTLLLRVTRLCSVLPWGPCWRLCLMSWCLTILGLFFLFFYEFVNSWRGWAVSFCHQWGARHRTSGYEWMLTECSNPVWLTQNV